MSHKRGCITILWSNEYLFHAGSHGRASLPVYRVQHELSDAQQPDDASQVPHRSVQLASIHSHSASIYSHSASIRSHSASIPTHSASVFAKSLTVHSHWQRLRPMPKLLRMTCTCLCGGFHAALRHRCHWVGSHCIGLGLCYDVFTLPETDSYTNTDTDSYNRQKSYTGADTYSDTNAKEHWEWVRFHLFGTNIGTKLGAVPICVRISTCIGISIGPLYTILNIIIHPNSICVGIGQCKLTIIVITSCSSAEIGSLNFVHFFCNAFSTIASSSSNFFVDILYHPKNLSSYLRKSRYNMKNSLFSNRKLFIGCIQTLLTWISRRCIIITKAKRRLLCCTSGKGIFAHKNSKSRRHFQYLLSKKWHNM